MAILTYTQAEDKMKVFSAFIREGLENGDQVIYIYPDEDSDIIKTKLETHEINVEKHEKDGTLILRSLTQYYLLDGKFDKDRTIKKSLEGRVEAKKRGYAHLRVIEDLGDFSFLDGQWQTYTDYWDDPRWDSPSNATRTYRDVLSYNPFIIELTAFNVEGINKLQLYKMLKAFWVGNPSYTVFIDLLEYTNAFSEPLKISHKKLTGRKTLLEFDPLSDYEKVVENFVKESMANVEPIFIFTPKTSPAHSYLAKWPTINFFLTSISTSTPESASENKVVLPAKNVPLILDAINKVLETYTDANICFVFDILTDLLTTIGRERTFTFLRQALNLLSSEKITSLFLLNPTAHQTKVVSRIRELFNSQLVHDKNGLKAVKIS